MYEGQNQRLQRKLKRLQHEKLEKDEVSSMGEGSIWERNLEGRCLQVYSSTLTM